MKSRARTSSWKVLLGLLAALILLVGCGSDVAGTPDTGAPETGSAPDPLEADGQWVGDLRLSSEVDAPAEVNSIGDLPHEPNPTAARFVRPFRDRGEPKVIEQLKADLLENINTKLRMNTLPPDSAMWTAAFEERKLTAWQEYQRIWVSTKVRVEYESLIEAIDVAVQRTQIPVMIEGHFEPISWQGVIIDGDRAWASVSGTDRYRFPDSWPRPGTTTGWVERPVQHNVELALEDGRWKFVAVSHADFGG